MSPTGQFIAKHFWLLMILTAFANGGIYWWRARAKMAASPELADELRDFIRGFVILFSIPWVVMGFGVVFGGVPTGFHFFNPKDLNPFVLAFHAAIFLHVALIARWVYFKGGAEFIAEHPDIMPMRGMPASPAAIKSFNALLIIVALTVEILMWVIDFPVPDVIG